MGPTKLNYKYNHLAAVSLPVCLSALHIECGGFAGTLCWPIYYNGHCSTGGGKCTFPHNGSDCNEEVKGEGTKTEGRKRVEKRHRDIRRKKKFYSQPMIPGIPSHIYCVSDLKQQPR